jgi:predicted SprT family Zn-dependent metalloprotease
MHFEERTPSNKDTKECIYLLSQEIDLNTSTLDEAPRSSAKEIVMHLGWHSYVHFADDLVLLLGEP